MKCPDCAGSLEQVILDGVSQTYRCLVCGGVWMTMGENDALPEKELNNPWGKIEVDREKFKYGDNKCPHDQSSLVHYHGEIAPSNLGVRKCPACHWWWFPEDSIFNLKQKPKEEIAATPKRKIGPHKIRNTLVSVASLALLITGGVMGLQVLQGEQKVNISASRQLRQVTGIRFEQGGGEVMFVYEGEIKSGVQMYLADEAKWVSVVVNKYGDERYQISFGSHMMLGEEIVIKVNGEETIVKLRSVKPE